jgi:hypothetical protein
VAQAAAAGAEERATALAIARRWAARAPTEAGALAGALADALFAREPAVPEARVALVDALAATGVAGLQALERASADASPMVRAEAAAALGRTRARDARP